MRDPVGTLNRTSKRVPADTISSCTGAGAKMNVPIANSRVARSLSMQRVCELYTTHALSQKVRRAAVFCATAKVLGYLFGHLGSQLLRSVKKRTTDQPDFGQV